MKNGMCENWVGILRDFDDLFGKSEFFGAKMKYCEENWGEKAGN